MCLEKDWENEMKIERICTTILKRPVEKKFGGSKYNYDVGGYLLTQVYTDDGNIGCATTYFGLIESGMATVRKIIDEELSSVLVGEDPHFVRFLRRKMYSRIEYYGITGVATMAISALDICLWDLVGKAAGVPTAMVLGASRKSVPAYAMVGWYFQDGLKGLVESCVNAAEEGFSAVKIKVGRGSLEDDLNRIKGVKYVPENVKVSICPDILTEEKFEVPIVAVNMPAGKVLRTFPSRVTVTFTVGASMFRSIRPEGFKVVADYNEVMENPSEKCNIYLRSVPHGVRNARISFNQVDYLIEEQ